MRATRAIAFLLVAMTALTGLLFAGGSQEDSSTATPGEPVQIEFWHSWAVEGPQGRVLLSMLDDFNAAHEGQIEVTQVYMGKKRPEKISTALASGDPPDIAWISSNMGNYADAGELIDMNRVYDEAIDREDIYPTLLTNLQYLGEDVVLPFENSNLVLYYNKRMLDEQGIEHPPTVAGEYTWDDFIRDAQQFTDVESGRYGWEPNLGHQMLSIMFWGAGGTFFSEDRQENLVATDPQMEQAMVKALSRFHRMLWVDTITANDIGDQGFGNFDVPFAIEGPWAVPRYTQPAGLFEMENLGIAPLPADPDTGNSATRWYAKALALFQTDSAHEEATMEFINWFYQPEQHARWSVEAGYLPVTQSAAAHGIWSDFAAENEWVNIFLNQVETMRLKPVGIPAQSDLNEVIDLVRYQRQTPEEAVQTYKEIAQRTLREFWQFR